MCVALATGCGGGDSGGTEVIGSAPSSAGGGQTGTAGKGGAGAAGSGGGASGAGTGGASGASGTGGKAGASGAAGTGGKAGAGGASGAGGTAGKGGGSGASGSGGSAGKPAGCGDVTSAGKCVSAGQSVTCVVPSGQGEPTLAYDTCEPFETCTVTAGKAACTLKPGACQPGTAVCKDTATVRTCENDGTWQETPCASCTATPAGPVCGGAVPTKPLSLSVAYEARGHDAALTGWSGSLFTAPASGATVVSTRKENGKDVIVDATYTDGQGDFTIKVPTTQQAGDRVVVYAYRAADGGTQNGMRFAVVQPSVPDGKWDVGTAVPGTGNAFWGWSWDVASVTQGQKLTITEANHSGAMRVFDYLRFVHNAASSLMGQTGISLVVWLRFGTSWSCGACMSEKAITVNGFKFASQIWIPAVAQDQSYWSDAVTAHELGHWVMASWGTSPGEGGTHYASCPTFPGQAWSEGWATFFSSLARHDPVYYDKQNGSFFWFDTDTKKYGKGAAWKTPTASAGLLQQMDENEVAAELWDLAQHPADAGTTLTANKGFMTAIAAPRMNTSPFARGYTRHTWSTSPDCSKSNVVDTGKSSPMYADYLDTLRCAGTTAAAVDAVTKPQTMYPYPSGSPICQ